MNGEDRAIVRPTPRNLTHTEFPGIMAMDADLYLLRDHSKGLRENLSTANRKTLNSFLENFGHFERSSRTMGMDLAYLYIQDKRARKEKRKFFARYGYDVTDIRKRIAGFYEGLAFSLRDSDALFLEAKGDYIFVQGTVEIPGLHLVREIDNYTVDSSKFKSHNQLSLAV